MTQIGAGFRRVGGGRGLVACRGSRQGRLRMVFRELSSGLFPKGRGGQRAMGAGIGVLGALVLTPPGTLPAGNVLLDAGAGTAPVT
ncbi:MAG TPA: hypothetical protein VES03_01270, partial [Motilibacterales bacterium]|nr:hypothetical protein [Motilibacterales bacterium]